MTDRIDHRPAGPTGRTQRGAATRHRILDAAVGALVELGYRRTTIREIATRAGVSHGAIFRHFGSRVDLLVAVVDLIHERQLAALRTIAADHRLFGAAWFDRVRTLARAPEEIAWFELVVAARHDDRLRARIGARSADQTEEIVRLAGELPATVILEEGARRTWVQLTRRALHGGALADLLSPLSPRLRPRSRGLIGLFLLLAGRDDSQPGDN